MVSVNVSFLKKTLLATLVATFSSSAFSAAFQLSETSVSGLGRAFAGEAIIADNASVVATNPALMVKLKRPEISAGAVFFAPRIDVVGKIDVTQHDASEKNIAPNKLVPQLYAVLPINDRFAIGAGVNVNYGLSTKYSEGFSAGFLGGETEMEAINLNFSGAYRFEKLSVGLGLNAVYAKANMTRHVGALVKMITTKYPILANSFKFPPNTILAKLKGHDIGFGANAGITYDFNENNRLGLAYHSPVVLNMKGKFSNGIHGILPAIANRLPEGLIATNGAVIDGKLHLVLPEYIELAGFHQLTDAFAFTYSAKWTKWDRLTELHAVANNDGKTLFRKKEYFKNSWRYAVGGIFDINPQWTVRTGLAYDNSAVDAYHSISIPDTDRTWLTLGATYRATENFSVDMGYAYIFGKKSHFTEDKGDSTASTFNVNARAMLYGLNFNYKF